VIERMELLLIWLGDYVMAHDASASVHANQCVEVVA